MEYRRKVSSLILLLSALPCFAQYTSYVRASIPKTAVVVFTGTLSSNANSTGIVATPSRKQLGNFGTGCSSGSITPAGVPVGQLYATTAIQTAAEGATPPCATQGVVNVTSSGTGIAAPDNGQNAGGTDSATAMTDTYGGTGDSAACTGDPHNADPLMIVGLPNPGCIANSSAVFQESTATGFGNSDVLFPTLYASNSTTLDLADHYVRSVYFYVGKLSTLHDWEMDINQNSSPTAYSGGTGGYFGWGTHWGASVTMFQYCPQNCSSWKTFKGIDVAGVQPNLTTYALTNNHYYHLIQYGHRNAGCIPTSGSNCYFYDMMTIYDVTTATAPVTYYLVDATSGNPAGGIPVNHSTWTSGITPQVQLDMTTANDNVSMHVDSDTVIFYYLQ